MVFIVFKFSDAKVRRIIRVQKKKTANLKNALRNYLKAF